MPDIGHFFIRHFDCFGIDIGIKLTLDFQSGLIACGGYQIYDNLMTDQGFTSPVLADKRKQPMFDLVPFVCSRAGSGLPEWIAPFHLPISAPPNFHSFIR